MAVVNREARSIVVSGSCELGLVTKARNDQYPVFIRTFKSEVDAMYIKPRQLDDVVTDVHRTMYEPWVEGRSWLHLSRYRNIAMSETSLVNDQELEEIPALHEDTCSISEILVVVSAPADLESAGNHDKEARLLWKFVPAPGDALYRDVHRQRFAVCGGERVTHGYVSCCQRFDVSEDERVGDGVVSALVGSKKGCCCVY
jgi:hypothetical protein